MWFGCCMDEKKRLQMSMRLSCRVVRRPKFRLSTYVLSGNTILKCPLLDPLLVILLAFVEPAVPH